MLVRFSSASTLQFHVCFNGFWRFAPRNKQSSAGETFGSIILFCMQNSSTVSVVPLANHSLSSSFVSSHSLMALYDFWILAKSTDQEEEGTSFKDSDRMQANSTNKESKRPTYWYFKMINYVFKLSSILIHNCKHRNGWMQAQNDATW